MLTHNINSIEIFNAWSKNPVDLVRREQNKNSAGIDTRQITNTSSSTLQTLDSCLRCQTIEDCLLTPDTCSVMICLP